MDIKRTWLSHPYVNSCCPPLSTDPLPSSQGPIQVRPGSYSEVSLLRLLLGTNHDESIQRSRDQHRPFKSQTSTHPGNQLWMGPKSGPRSDDEFRLVPRLNRRKGLSQGGLKFLSLDLGKYPPPLTSSSPHLKSLSFWTKISGRNGEFPKLT